MAAVSLIMLAALSVLGVRTYSESRKVLEQELVGRLEVELQYWAHRAVEHRIMDIKERTLYFANLPEVRELLSGVPGGHAPQSAVPRLSVVVKEGFTAEPALVRVVVMRADGREVWRGEQGGAALAPAKLWRECPCFREAVALSSGMRATANIYLVPDKKTGGMRPLLCTVAPVLEGGRTSGAVIVDTDFVALLRNSPAVMREGTIYLVDRKGRVLYWGKTGENPSRETSGTVALKDVAPDLATLIGIKDACFQFSDADHLHGFIRVYLNRPYDSHYFIVAYSVPRQVLLEGLGRVTGVFALTGLAVFLVSLFLVGLLASAVARPVAELAAVADRVAAGDLSVRVKEMVRRDEVGRLYQSFNRMVTALQEAQSRAEEKKARLLEAAGEAAVDVTRNLSVPVILEKLAQSVVRIVEADCACLHLRSEEGVTHFFAAGEGSREWAVMGTAGGGGLAAMVFEKGDIVRLTEAEMAFSSCRPLRAIKAFLGVPVFGDGRVIGALCVGSSKGPITEADEAAVRLLAAHAGVALSNARLHQEVLAMAENLERRVEERTRELKAMNIELERANRLKSECLAMMSHELRAPLNTIIGFTDVLLSDSFPDMPEKAREYLRDIMESGEHLLSLINDVLDLAKIEAGKEKLYLEEIPVADFIRGTVLLFREKAAKHGIQVEVSTEGVSEWVLDGRKFRQILFNLLSNAFKFTPDGGKIGVEAKIEGNVLAVTVWDTGIGIPEEDLPRLFKPFEQLDSSLTRHYSGTGLGLAMVKKLAELHGGTVSVQSEPGKGSRFTVYFPLLTYAREDLGVDKTYH
ncbi:MAG: ATP-binding protein [Thermodesulfitimonas sp.]